MRTLDYTRMRMTPLVGLVWSAGAALAAQSGARRPAIAVINLRFDGEHANVLGPGDTAVVAAATSKLLATLRASDLVPLVDSTPVPAAVAGARAGRTPPGHAPRGARARPPGARPVATGTTSTPSNLV